MSQTETPEVIQGRLGWESGDLSEDDPAALTQHPKNTEIYGDTDDPSNLGEKFIDSVRQNGVLEPIIITGESHFADGKVIISGHRRQLAAVEVGKDRVPIIYYTFDSPLEEREALIELNRQRDKTPGQLVNEFEEILAIEEERARERRESNLKRGDKSPDRETFHTREDEGRAKDKAAEKIDAPVSGRTLEKGLKVKKAAEEGDEVGQQEWDKLFSGDTSFHTAAKRLEKSEAEEEIQKQQRVNPEQEPRVYKSDAVEFLRGLNSPDLVIADPPYSTEVDDIDGFASEWVPAMLDAIGDAGRAFVFIGAYPGEVNAYLNVLSEESALGRTTIRVWNYRNTTGKAPKFKYRQNWQAILFIQSEPPVELDAPKKSELAGVQEFNQPHEFGDVEPSQHKWQKPRDLLGQMIRHASEHGDFVVDPFVGSGSTVLEAAELGRRSIGVDIDPDALDTAIQRGCVWEEDR